MIPPSGILVEFFAALDEHVHQGSGIGSAGCIAQTHLLALQQQHARGQFTTFLWLQFSPACNFASETRSLAQKFTSTNAGSTCAPPPANSPKEISTYRGSDKRS